MADVVCLGILVADIWARPVDEFERGRLAVVQETGIGLGGCAANTGVGLARLGVSTAVQGCVGVDGLGDLVLDALRRDGIDVSGIYRTVDANTSSTLVLIDSAGERTFLHCRAPAAPGRRAPYAGLRWRAAGASPGAGAGGRRDHLRGYGLG